VALALIWSGCHKAEKLNQPSTFKPPAGAVELKLKWPAGERIDQQMDLTVDNEVSLPGQKEPTQQQIEMGQGYRLAVLKDTPDGGHEVEMEFLSAKMAVAMNGQNQLEYDSSRKTSDGKSNPAADIFGKMVGAKIQYFLDASNQVLRIEGVDDLMARLSASQPNSPLAAMKSMFSPDYFKQMMSANRFLPPHPVQLNDTWPAHIDMTLGGMGKLEMDYEITLQSWEMHGPRNCARLEFQGTMKTSPGTNSSLPGGVTISRMDGTSAGVSWFDPELGLTIDTTMNQDLQMVMSVQIPGRGGDSAKTQTMTNAMKESMILKMVSVH
jgi:hypothetical protein